MVSGKMSSVKLSAAVAVLFTSSACCQTVEPPRSVSDFCLNDRQLSSNAAPAAGIDDPGNQYDSDETLLSIYAHNAVHQSLCPSS